MDYFSARKVNPQSYAHPCYPGWIKQQLKGDTRLRILDIGCGLGQTMSVLRHDGFCNIQGLDACRESLSFCQSAGLTVQFCDLNAGLPEKSDTFSPPFDIVLLNHVLEHLEKGKIVDILRQIRQLLRPDTGRLLLSVPNAQANTAAYWAYEDFTHTTLFTSGSLYYVGTLAGFSSIEFVDIDCTAGMGRWYDPILWILRKSFLPLYRANRFFWNVVTSSPYHAASPPIYSYEIKAVLS